MNPRHLIVSLVRLQVAIHEVQTELDRAVTELQKHTAPPGGHNGGKERANTSPVRSDQ